MQPTSDEMLSLDVRVRDCSPCILLGKTVYDSVHLIDLARVVSYLQSEVNNPFSNFSRFRGLNIVRTNMKNNQSVGFLRSEGIT